MEAFAHLDRHRVRHGVVEESVEEGRDDVVVIGGLKMGGRGKVSASTFRPPFMSK